MLLMLLPGIPFLAQDNAGVSDTVADPVRAFVTGGFTDSTGVAVYVLDLADGRVLGEYNADRPMVPASVMKCVTTASLLEKVGENWRYETPVYTDGRIRNGVLEGNIVVEGSADPSVNSRHDPESEDIVAEIIAALRKQHIDTVRGRICIDESRFAGPAVNPGWASGDLSQAYGTGSHGFNFEDNASGKASVRDPAQVFRNRLSAAMARAGIVLQDSLMKQGHRKHFLTHHSAGIDEIMRSCMMRSDNQYAEGMLRTLSRTTGGDGSSAGGAARMKEYWRGRHLPMEGVEIVDGSGLSRRNRLTARFLGTLLGKMADNPHYASFFPLAGQEGTLRRFLAGTPLEGYVAMKTGSMNGIQSYAGYKLDDNYVPTHVVVIMVNNMANRARAREGIRQMLEKIFL